MVRVEIYLKAGKPDMAQPVAATLVKACASDWRSHYAQAQAEAQLRNFKSARAALGQAFAHDVLHGGWCPKGRKAEDGVIPTQFQHKETSSENYSVRTRRNVRESGRRSRLNGAALN